MIVARFVAYIGVCLVAFAALAVAGCGLVHLSDMLSVADTAPWAKAVIVAGVAGIVVVALAGWWDASRGGER